MSERITKVQTSDLTLLHLFDQIEADGQAGQLIAFRRPVPDVSTHYRLTFGPAANPITVFVDPAADILILDADKERKPVAHWGVQQ